MPDSKKFWEIYNGIHEILEPYGITDIMVAYRKSVARTEFVSKLYWLTI